MDYKRCILGILSALAAVQVCTGQVFLEDNYLIVADRSNGGIYQVNPEDGTVNHLPEISLTSPGPLAIHPYTGDIYVSDETPAPDNDTITRFSVANRTPTVFYEFPDPNPNLPISFGGLAIDPERELLYVARIFVFGGLTVIYELDLVSGKELRTFSFYSLVCCSLELDHVSRILYWTDTYGPLRGIVQLELNLGTFGPKPYVRLPVPLNVDPTALAVDLSTRELYFAAGENGTIQNINMDGPPRRVVVHHDGTGHDYGGMTLDKEYIYFTDAQASNIRRINRKTHESSDFSGQGLNNLTGIGFFSRRNSTTTNMPTGSTTESSISTTQTTPVVTCGNHQYKCPSGECAHVYSKCDGISDCSGDSDESSDTCPSGTEPYLMSEYLVVAEATSGFLYQVSISSGELRRIPERSTQTLSSRTKGLAIDPGTQDLYLLDPVSNNHFDLRKFEWNTKTSSVVYNSSVSGSNYLGLALDLENQLVYVSNIASAYKQINEWNLSDGTLRQIQEGLDATSIVYDSTNRMLYWSGSSSQKYGIFKCSVAASDTPQPITGIIKKKKVPTATLR